MRKFSKTALVFIFAISIAALSHAQQKMRVEARATGVFTQYHKLELADAEDHLFSLYEAKGAGTGNNGGFTYVNRGRSELTGGKGTHDGVNKSTDRDGDIWFSRWKGTVDTVETPGGKSTIAFQGNWEIAGGTGKWENAEGEGTYKGIFVGESTPGVTKARSF
jgi:hypothetical protein